MVTTLPGPSASVSTWWMAWSALAFTESSAPAQGRGRSSRRRAALPGNPCRTPAGLVTRLGYSPTHQRLAGAQGILQLDWLTHSALPALPTSPALASAGAGGKRIPEAVAWLLAQRNRRAMPRHSVPGCQTRPMTKGRCRRSASGSPGATGISVLVVVAGWARAMNDMRPRPAALELCRKSADVRSPSGMTDACLCHGAAGNAHLSPTLSLHVRAGLRRGSGSLSTPEPWPARILPRGTGFRFCFPTMRTIRSLAPMPAC